MEGGETGGVGAGEDGDGVVGGEVEGECMQPGRAEEGGGEGGVEGAGAQVEVDK